MEIGFIFIIIILILSIVIHEVSHGYVAQMLGDPTARLAGRLTLNPIPHIDPLGSVIIPAILVLTGANILFGWAKPVPYNPYNLRNQKWGEAIVAIAGPLTNLSIAIVFGLLIRFGILFDYFSVASPFVELASFVVYINILLAIFNLIPIPPLDGSKVLASILPPHLHQKYMDFQALMMRYGMFAMFGFVLLFMYFIWPIFSVIIFYIFSVITGIGF